MRQYLGVIIGVVLGVVGALLYGQSKPPETGSQKERAELAEQRYRSLQRENRELRADGLRARKRGASDGTRAIYEDILSGRGADLDDVFQVTKPWLTKIAPVINLIRVKEEKDHFNSIAGEYGRKYELSERQQNELREWLDQRATENAASFVGVLTDERSNLMDLMLAGREAEKNLGEIDGFMEGQLRGQALADFKQDRLMERIESVEHEANGRLHRLDNLVDLDPAQEDQLFYLMARSSDSYIPAMEIEGMTGSTLPIDPIRRNEAIRGVLRPGQLESFDTHRRERRADAEREMLEVGLRLPDDWDLFDEDDW
ncbi:MAG: hypothetical protein VCA37_20540 [Roseibacillus sp.]